MGVVFDAQVVGGGSVPLGIVMSKPFPRRCRSVGKEAADTATKVPVKSENKASPTAVASWAPFDSLRREIVSTNPWGLSLARPAFPFEMLPWPRQTSWAVNPAVDISEKDGEFEISAELPGMTEKNIDVKMSNGNLVIKGEKSEEAFIGALRAAGLVSAGELYSVALAHQAVTASTLSAITQFVSTFDRIAAREAWMAAVTREAPAIAQAKRREACFFSTFDFHLLPKGGFQMIDFNDNGSGLLFAGLVNAVYYETAGLGRDPSLQSPIAIAELRQRVGEFIETEATSFFGASPEGLYMILAACRTELFHILGIVENGRFRLPWRFDLAALAPVDPATGLYL